MATRTATAGGRRTAARSSGGTRGSAAGGPANQTSSPTRARTARRARPAADRAIDKNTLNVDVPFMGTLRLPEPQRLAWYAGLAALAAFGIVEWPVVLALGIGHLLSEDHHNRLLQDFGRAIEEAA
ncbi:hypothetical protein [Actinopolymorpha alba]|uniref:hypothetical protein n=1 Tax=Actinopolymorpha alba TaxID=533267 RepID=UPI00035E4939|nr:hypothetical protein [Actinopolymorpha alba]